MAEHVPYKCRFKFYKNVKTGVVFEAHEQLETYAEKTGELVPCLEDGREIFSVSSAEVEEITLTDDPGAGEAETDDLALTDDQGAENPPKKKGGK